MIVVILYSFRYQKSFTSFIGTNVKFELPANYNNNHTVLISSNFKQKNILINHTALNSLRI